MVIGWLTADNAAVDNIPGRVPFLKSSNDIYLISPSNNTVTIKHYYDCVPVTATSDNTPISQVDATLPSLVITPFISKQEHKQCIARHQSFNITRDFPLICRTQIEPKYAELFSTPQQLLIAAFNNPAYTGRVHGIWEDKVRLVHDYDTLWLEKVKACTAVHQ